MQTDYLSLLSKHTAGKGERAVPALLIHSALVTKKALDIAQQYMKKHPNVKIDLRHLEEMGMLHDIGVFDTHAPEIDLHGDNPYVSHIERGGKILEDEGLHHLAPGARNHMSITADEIRARNLSLPEQDFLPQTPEEEILCLADYFYSKFFDTLFVERSYEEVRERMQQFGDGAVQRFVALYEKYLS